MGAILQDIKFASGCSSKIPLSRLWLFDAWRLGSARILQSSASSTRAAHTAASGIPNQLLFLSGEDLRTKASGILVSYTKFTQIREQNTRFKTSEAYYGSTLSLLTQRSPKRSMRRELHATVFSDPRNFTGLGT